MKGDYATAPGRSLASIIFPCAPPATGWKDCSAESRVEREWPRSGVRGHLQALGWGVGGWGSSGPQSNLCRPRMPRGFEDLKPCSGLLFSRDHRLPRRRFRLTLFTSLANAVCRSSLMRSNSTLAGSSLGSWGTSSPRGKSNSSVVVISDISHLTKILRTTPIK